MRTITFEVEVDGEIIPSFVPNIYDEVFKQTPHGRLFLCNDKTSGAKKLVRLHRGAEEGGKEAPWFENFYLPDETRIVGMTGGDAAECVNGKSKLLEEKEPHQIGTDAIPDAISSSTLHDDHRSIIETVCGLSNVIDLINENVLNLMQNQEANRDYMYAKFEEAFKHFKQVHDDHNSDCINFADAEQRIKKHVQQCCDKATLTTQQYAEAIMVELHKLWGGKSLVSDSDKPLTSATDVTPQALLKALEIVSRTIWSSAKSE